MPASFAAYDRARDCITAIPEEDAVVLRPREPYRVLREVFQVLLRHGGLTRETRRHLVVAFNVALDPSLERKVMAALCERWDGDMARGLSEALADVAWEPCPNRGCHMTIEHAGPCIGAYEPDVDVAAV